MENLRVLVVDDSIIFRSQIRSALEGIRGVEVVGATLNGKLALEKVKQTSVDLITLDMEMPEMNGLQTLKELRALGSRARVIVFSSQTQRGADLALEALTHGADDVVAKPTMRNSSSFEEALNQIRSDLVPKILQFVSNGRSDATSLAEGAGGAVLKDAYPQVDLDRLHPAAVVVGSSTGGPDALERVFAHMGSGVRCPIFIAQHMPPVFTASLAKRLSQLSGIEAEEGRQFEEVRPNRIYVAPGDYHMSLVNMEGKVKIRLDQGPLRNSVRPAVDNLFESAAAIYGKNLAAFVLTGMGEDGLVGAKVIKRAGGGLMIQSKDSCVVFGMPGAIYHSGCHDRMGDLEAIHQLLKKMLHRGSIERFL